MLLIPVVLVLGGILALVLDLEKTVLLQTSMSADFRYDRFRTGWSGYRNGSRQLL
jgi:hypothetical protein